jgi:hypothetical protein
VFVVDDENVIASTLELILMMMVGEGAAQEKAQLISQIVSSVVVQSHALQVQISKGALGAEFLGAVPVSESVAGVERLPATSLSR